MTRRIAFTVVAVALGVGALALPAGAAKTTNPCKVLKQSEITTAIGGTVSAGKKGLATAVSKRCDYQVTASPDYGDGAVSVGVMTIGGEAAYDGLKDQSALYVAVPELGKALYSSKTGALSVLLKNGTYLTVQGALTNDAEPQLVKLIKIAKTRV